MTPATERKKAEHVILKSPSTMECLHCGETYEMNMPVPLDVLIAATKAFGLTHENCTLRDEDGPACERCLAFGHAPDACPGLAYQGDWRHWAEGPDTGVSSIAICKKLMPKDAHFGFDVSVHFASFGTTPSDPSDSVAAIACCTRSPAGARASWKWRASRAGRSSSSTGTNSKRSTSRSCRRAGARSSTIE